MPEPFSALVITRRAEEAPMAAASRRSVNCTQLRSAGAEGCSSRPVETAWSPKARSAVVSPTTRPASDRRSSTCTPLCEMPLPSGCSAVA